MSGGIHEASATESAIVQALLAGRYDEANALLSRQRGDLDPALATEFAANIEFQTARLRHTEPLTWGERGLWRLLVSSKATASAVMALHGCGAALLSALGLRRWATRKVLSRDIGDILHHRYTNFARGLRRALWLHALLGQHDLLRRHYLAGLIGHFFGMSGRFDQSLPWLRRSRLALLDLVTRDPTHERAYLYFCEILAIEALHKSYAGHHRDALAAFEDLFTRLESRPYWWIEVFARSMRLHAAMETLGEPMLRSDAARLKRLLGRSFANKYALRTTAYSALLAAINGYRNLALAQLLESEQFYKDTTIPIERSRYHFVRALSGLELGEHHFARRDARAAVANLCLVPGARFHATEADLLDIEVRLRLALAAPDASDPLDARMLMKRLRRAERHVRGSAAVDAKIAGLKLLLRFADGETLAAATTLPQLIARLREHAPRLALTIEPLTGRGSGERLHRAPQLQALKEEFNLIDHMIRVLDPKRSPSDMEQLIRAILGGSSCTMTTQERSAPSAIHDIGSFKVLHDDGAELAISMEAGPQQIEFTVSEPIRSLQFDERVRRGLELAVAIIQSAYLSEALIESQRLAAVGMTSQLLAHDIRKPFSLLKISIERMRAASTLAEMRAILDRGEHVVGRALSQAEEMIQDVMSVGTRRPARREKISLATLWAEVLEETVPDDMRDITLTRQFGHQAYVLADPARMARVLHNLLDNALHATGPGGHVWIKTTDRPPNMIELTIGNSGSWIPASELAQIFEPFYTSGKPQGTGLGLAIARQVVEDHGGTIWCTSDPKLGTEFKLTLPALSAKDAANLMNGARPGAQDDATQDGALQVVIVDDDPFVLDAWRSTLRDCQVHAFETPEDLFGALNEGRVRAHELSCVITDYHFERTTLDPYVRRLQELSAPLVLASDASVPRSSMKFQAIIDKTPLNSESLLALLRGCDRRIPMPRPPSSPSASIHAGHP